MTRFVDSRWGTQPLTISQDDDARPPPGYRFDYLPYDDNHDSFLSGKRLISMCREF